MTVMAAWMAVPGRPGLASKDAGMVTPQRDCALVHVILVSTPADMVSWGLGCRGWAASLDDVGVLASCSP